MKIGILTFHRALNCGAMLQAWALKCFLEQQGHSVGFINNHVGVIPRWFSFSMSCSFLGVIKGAAIAAVKNIGSFGCLDLALKRFGNFQRNFLPEVDINEYECIVVGSDQVWRPSLTKSETALFRGENFPTRLPIISYAASYGDNNISESDILRLAESLDRWSALSVREDLVKNHLSRYIKKNIEVVADPTMLLDINDYSRIAVKKRLKKPYLFAYAVHATPFFVKTATIMAKKLGLNLIMTSTSQYTRWGAPKGMTYAVSPDMMIGYIQDAECVVASSFHGTVLSVIHKKPFVCLREDGFNPNARPVSFLIRIGEAQRVITPSSTMARIVQLLRMGVSKSAEKKLDQFRLFSSSWLIETLKSSMR